MSGSSVARAWRATRRRVRALRAHAGAHPGSPADDAIGTAANFGAPMTLLLPLLLAAPAHANSMLKEMTNAVELGAGDSARDELVRFTLHFGAEEPVVVTGKDYDTFKIFASDEGLPTQLELYAGKGEEKHNILINVAAARYYRLNIEKRGRDWEYDFHFYY
jgi:hypothetical protein